VTPVKLLDPVCDMVVDVAGARDHGLALERPERVYVFCSQGCLAKFAMDPEAYRSKVDAWLSAEARGAHAPAHPHADQPPVIDAGMREWYKACRCCMHDAYPQVVEQLDAERAALAQPPSGAGICETAEAQPPLRP
jgi:YHS domain-containing protein